MNSLGADTHTYIHTHTNTNTYRCLYQNNFKKPGARWLHGLIEYLGTKYSDSNIYYLFQHYHTCKIYVCAIIKCSCLFRIPTLCYLKVFVVGYKSIQPVCLSSSNQELRKCLIITHTYMEC